MGKPRRTHCPHCHAEYPSDHWAKIDAARARSVQATADERRKNGGTWGANKKLCDPFMVVALYKIGYTANEIANKMAFAPATIRRVIAAHKKVHRLIAEHVNK